MRAGITDACRANRASDWIRVPFTLSRQAFANTNTTSVVAPLEQQRETLFVCVAGERDGLRERVYQR